MPDFLKRPQNTLSPQRRDTAQDIELIELTASFSMSTFYLLKFSSFISISDVQKESTIKVAELQSKIAHLHPVVHDVVQDGPDVSEKHVFEGPY